MNKNIQAQAHCFKTSLGEVEIITLNGKTRVYSGKENLSHFELIGVSLVADDAWALIHLEDGAYGAPEYKVKPLPMTDERVKWLKEQRGLFTSWSNSKTF